MKVRPYGDTTNDGMVQVSLTLPLAASDLGKYTAIELAKRMGLERARVVHMMPVEPGFSFYVIYGCVVHAVDTDFVSIPAREFPVYSYAEINRMIKRVLKRKLVVVGATTGTDAHTVGLDSILSLKGYAGDKGLENYPEMRIVNLGSQVTPKELVGAAIAEQADAVLVSQVVTQRDVHLRHLTDVRREVEDAGVRSRTILVAGGPGLTPDAAAELGYDQAFGKWTRPSEVASYLAWRATQFVSSDSQDKPHPASAVTAAR